MPPITSASQKTYCITKALQPIAIAMAGRVGASRRKSPIAPRTAAIPARSGTANRRIRWASHPLAASSGAGDGSLESARLALLRISAAISPIVVAALLSGSTKVPET